jgi:hypothetical protein
MDGSDPAADSIVEGRKNGIHQFHLLFMDYDRPRPTLLCRIAHIGANTPMFAPTSLTMGLLVAKN